MAKKFFQIIIISVTAAQRLLSVLSHLTPSLCVHYFGHCWM